MHLYLQRYLKLARNFISRCGHSNWDIWKKIAQSLSLFFWRQKILKFFYKWTKIIHKFEGCFLSGQVCSNSFKVFNRTWIVEPWILLVHFQKSVRVFVFRKCCDWTIFLSWCPGVSVHTVNDKITASYQTNTKGVSLPKCCIKRYISKNELWKTFTLTSFQKFEFQSILISSCLSMAPMPSFAVAMLFIPFTQFDGSSHCLNFATFLTQCHWSF